MKKLNKILLFAGLVFAAVGCEKDQVNATFTGEGEDAQSAYFTQKTVSEEFVASATGDQTVLVDIYRQSSSDELKVGIDYVVAAGGEEFYEVPESVTFPAGEYHTTVPVIVHGVENFAKGASYSVTLYVGDYHEFEPATIAQLGTNAERGLPNKSGDTRAVSISKKYTEITLTTTLSLEWEPCYILSDPSKLLDDNLTEADYVKGADGNPMKQTCVYTYNFWWVGQDDEIVLERAKGTTVFRMTNWGGGVNIIFTINPEDKSIVLTNQKTGASYDDGTPIMVSDVPSLLGEPFAQYPSTWDGKYGFKFSLVYTLEDGRWFGETCEETLVLDSGVAVVEDPAPAVKIVYDGLEVSQLGVKSHKLSFTPNADAAKYFATVIKTDPELAAKADQALRETLANMGVEEYSSDWFYLYANNYDAFFRRTAGQYAASLFEEIGEAMIAGTYEGAFKAFEFTKASSEVWDLGTEGGSFTAVAVSVDKTGEFKNLDFHTFVYNPESDGAAVDCDIAIDAYPNPGYGYFDYNSIYFSLRSPSLGDITKVQYALLTKAEFEAAALTDNEKLLAYVGEHGKSLGADDLEALNDTNIVTGGFETWLNAAPDTEYKLVLAISNPDATRVEVLDHTTAPAAEPQKLVMATGAIDSPDNGIYAHTHLIANFMATEVVEGYYLTAAPAKLQSIVSVGEDGKVSLADGVTAEALAGFLAENGSAFATGSNGDLARFNSGNVAQKIVKTNSPATEFVVLACVMHGNGEISWAAKAQRTAYAPAVAFTQTVQANGSTIMFNWSAAPAASIFVVTDLQYALVPQSALAAAGVDMSKLSDEELNDFDARIDAGGDKTAIEAQRANAQKVLEVLAMSAKSFRGDAAMAINYPGGINKQFSNVAAGDYALITVANDSFNSKLTVGQVSVQ